MKTEKLFKILVLLTVCFMAACSENSDESGPVGSKSLQVTPGKLTFTSAGGTQQLQVKTTYDYYGYDISADWLSGSFQKDSKYNYINITAAPNTSKESRTATIRVTGSNDKNSNDEFVNVIVEQEGSGEMEGNVTIVTSKGGTIDEGDLSMSFPEGTFKSSTKVAVAEVKAGETLGKEAEKSTFYTITLDGPTEKEFTLTLKGKDTNEDTRAVRRSVGVNLHTGMTLEYTLPVDATSKDGVYTVTIPQIDCEEGERPVFTMGLATVPTESSKATTRGTVPDCEVTWGSKWFLNSVDKQILKETREYAEEAFKALAKLGFEKPNRTVPFIIQPVDKSWGNHVQAKFFNADCYIELNEAYFKNLLDASEKDLQELRRTLIHESSHYYHGQLYDKRSAPVKTAKGLLGDEWTLLSEAIGGWTEKQTAPYEMDNNVYDNRDLFIKEFFPSKLDMNTSIAHGYGMGIAIEYLAKHTSDQDIVKLLEYQRDKKATTLRKCFDVFLSEHGMKLFDFQSYGTFLDELMKGKIDKRFDITSLAHYSNTNNILGYYEGMRTFKEELGNWGASITQIKVKTSDIASVDNKVVLIKEKAKDVWTDVYVVNQSKVADMKLVGTATVSDSIIIDDLKQFEKDVNMRIFLVSRKLKDDDKALTTNTTVEMLEVKVPKITKIAISYGYTDTKGDPHYNYIPRKSSQNSTGFIEIEGWVPVTTKANLNDTTVTITGSGSMPLYDSWYDKGAEQTWDVKIIFDSKNWGLPAAHGIEERQLTGTVTWTSTGKNTNYFNGWVKRDESITFNLNTIRCINLSDGSNKHFYEFAQNFQRDELFRSYTETFNLTTYTAPSGEEPEKYEYDNDTFSIKSSGLIPFSIYLWVEDD
jgi:hypothetical protein